MSQPNTPFAPSELILNSDGSIYHLKLKPEHIADTIFMVGDPSRAATVSQHFEKIEHSCSNREFVTHTGWYKGKRVSVVSTGIGTDNVEIVLTELDALANIDFNTRTVKPSLSSLKIIRIGTTGSIQADVAVGSHIVSITAIGLDSLMNFYHLPQSEDEIEALTRLKDELSVNFLPYKASCSEELRSQYGYDMISGHTITCPGFYAPQGRQLRIKEKNSSYLSALTNFNNHGITNLEMETAGYYAFGRIMGHEVVSTSVVLANRITNQFASNPEELIENLITTVLSRI